MQGQGDAVANDEGVSGRTLRRRNPVVRDSLAFGLGGDRGIARVQEHLKLCLVEVLGIRGCGGGGHRVGVVEDQAEVAKPAGARLRADGGQAGLDPREAQRALLGLAGLVVEVDLLVRAAGDTLAPAAAPVLVDQHDAVLLAFVHRSRRAAGDAGGIEAVFADPRQVEHEDRLEVELHLLGHGDDVRVGEGALGSAGQVVLPVRSPVGDHLPPRQGGASGHARRLRAGRGGYETGVVIGERIVIVVDGGQIRVVEDRRQPFQPAPSP